MQVISGRAALVRRAAGAGRTDEVGHHAEILDAKSRELVNELNRVVALLRGERCDGEETTVAALVESSVEALKEDYGDRLRFIAPRWTAQAGGPVRLCQEDFRHVLSGVVRGMLQRVKGVVTLELDAALHDATLGNRRRSEIVLECRFTGAAGPGQSDALPLPGQSDPLSLKEPWFSEHYDPDDLVWCSVWELIRVYGGKLSVEGACVHITWPLESRG